MASLTPRVGTLEGQMLSVETSRLAGPINVKDAPYNCTLDGVTADTVGFALALANADATGRAIYIPRGVLLTDTQVYRAQTILGDGSAWSKIKGLPGKDILNLDPALGAFARQRQTFRDIGFIVDDSVNAAASFPQRGGVGNAAISADWTDANVQALKFNLASMENVDVSSLSGIAGGQNNSCGFYWQAMPNLSRFRNVSFFRLAYGWWDHYPTSNLTSFDLYSDHNHFDGMYFNFCGKAFRRVNCANEAYDDIVIHGGSEGWIFKAVQSQYRVWCGEVHIGTFMIEGVSTPIDWAGLRNGTIETGLMTGGTQPIEIACDVTTIDGLTINTVNDPLPIARITGDRNEIKRLNASAYNSTAYGVRDLIDDQGQGNRVYLSSDQFDEASIGLPEWITRDTRILHARDSTSHLMGHVDPMFVAGDDLIVSPFSIQPAGLQEGVGYSYVQDTNADFGTFLRVASPGNFYATSNFINGKYGFRVGEFLPKGNVRIYVKAKVPDAASQSWFLHAATGGGAATQVGTGSLPLTTSFTVQSFDADLSSRAPGDTLQLTTYGNPSGTGVTDIAWVAFRPFAKDALVEGYAEGIEIADPAAPPTNHGRAFWRDNGSGKTQYCVRFPTGAVQVLATEP